MRPLISTLSILKVFILENVYFSKIPPTKSKEQSQKQDEGNDFIVNDFVHGLGLDFGQMYKKSPDSG
jgi:hypothetical protein